MCRFVTYTQYLGNSSFVSSISLAAVLLMFTGCGREDADSDASAATRGAPSAAAVAQVPGPTDVVSQFLDRVRRGGQDSDAGLLLTSRAQSELYRIGRTVQPIGSPDAVFNVTRSESVPGEKDSVLVHSIWSEPAEDGTNSDYQVVWAVQQENGNWRISGLAMELEPGQAPTIIDFENGDLMAQLLDHGSESAKSSQPAAAQASTTPEAVAR